METKAILALENGEIFHGISIGIEGISTGEVVFNTAMTGYQEILTDPSYANQIITFTHTHIGNVGVNSKDIESKGVSAAGMVIRQYSNYVSNWRAQQSLGHYLKENRIVAISDIDTRHLTRVLRTQGTMKGCIMTGEINEKIAFELIRNSVEPVGLNLTKRVATMTTYEWQNECRIKENKFDKRSEVLRIVVYDFGVKHSILNSLVNSGCQVLVVPPNTCLSDLLKLGPDGVVLSNGPGDPADSIEAIQIVRHLLEADLPILGICFGHQLLALALGSKTIKMKFGHHGANHPVLNLENGCVLITSQNHGYVVDEPLSSALCVTYRSLFDGSLQGIRHINKPVYGFQGHPEAGPGPSDANFLFNQFIMDVKKQRAVLNNIKVRHYAEAK